MLLIAPGAQDSPFAGTPTSTLGRLFLVGVFSLVTFLIVFKPVSQIRARWLAVLVLAALLKIIAGTQGAIYGWRGSYELTDTVPAAIGRFTWQLGRHTFRIDREVNFEGSAFGLHFVNDIGRYGYDYALHQRDVDLPLRISWTGYLQGDTREPVVVHISGNGVFTMALDGSRFFEATNPGSAVVPLPLGPRPVHILQVIYQKPAKVVPAARVIVTSGNRILEVTPSPAAVVPAWREGGAALVTTAGVLVGAVALSWLFLSAFWDRTARRLACRGGGDPVVGLAIVATCTAFGVLTWSNASSLAGATYHLRTGDDPFWYESAATEIVHHGLLMPFGAAPGHGSAYYFYPFYSYVRAATQFLVGEDFAVAILMSGLCLAAVPLLFWTLGWSTIRARWVGLAGVVALAWFLHRHVVFYTLWGHTDVLFILMVFVSLNLVRIAVQRSSARLAVCAGISVAFTAACRPSFMTFMPVLVIAYTFVPALAPLRMPRRVASYMLVGFLIGLAPFAARNYVMAGKFVLLVESWIQIPYFLVPPEIPNPVNLNEGIPTLGKSVSWAWSIVREHPLRSLIVELRKIAFTLGLTNLGMPGQSFQSQLHIEFVLLTFGFSIVMARGLLPFATAVTLGCFALSHLAAMVLAAPWTYGYKTILPLHLAFLFAVVTALAAYRDKRPAGSLVGDFVQSRGAAAVVIVVFASMGLTACRPRAMIDVLEGSYGQNCGVPRGNSTRPLATACGGKLECAYQIDVATLGDPATGCAKAFEAVWRCGNDRTLRRTSAAAEAGLGSVVRLMCP